MGGKVIERKMQREETYVVGRYRVFWAVEGTLLLTLSAVEATEGFEKGNTRPVFFIFFF